MPWLGGKVLIPKRQDRASRSAYTHGGRGGKIVLKSTAKGVTLSTKKPKKRGLKNVEKRQVKKIIDNRRETKYGTFFQFDIRNAHPANPDGSILSGDPLGNTGSVPGTQGANALCCQVLQTGAYLTPSCTGVNTAFATSGSVEPCTCIGGYSMPGQAGGFSEIQSLDGYYAHAQSQRVDFIISMNTLVNEAQLDRTYFPTEFRVLVVRAKPHAESQTSSLGSALFLNNQGGKLGLTSGSAVAGLISPYQIMNNLKVNPGQWTKTNEWKFTLINPSEPDLEINLGTSPDNNVLNQFQLQRGTAHAHEKKISFYLDKPKKKLKFSTRNDVNLNNYEPVNYDFNNYIVILASQGNVSQNGGGTANGWSVMTGGCSKFKDM